MDDSVLSRHALKRARQRGITNAQINAVIRHADESRHRGQGTEAIWISRNKLRRLGPMTPEGVNTDRLRGLIVLLSADQATVTVLRNLNARSYRRSG